MTTSRQWIDGTHSRSKETTMYLDTTHAHEILELSDEQVAALSGGLSFPMPQPGKCYFLRVPVPCLPPKPPVRPLPPCTGPRQGWNKWLCTPPRWSWNS
jgi:hypothetical protein